MCRIRTIRLCVKTAVRWRTPHIQNKNKNSKNNNNRKNTHFSFFTSSGSVCVCAHVCVKHTNKYKPVEEQHEPAFRVEAGDTARKAPASSCSRADERLQVSVYMYLKR